MAGDFVASRGNVSDQLRMLLCYASQHKKRSSNVELLEDSEQFLSVADHTRLT
jgi:hypothetical protein